MSPLLENYVELKIDRLVSSALRANGDLTTIDDMAVAIDYGKVIVRYGRLLF
jgi:hypothetical protein